MEFQWNAIESETRTYEDCWESDSLIRKNNGKLQCLVGRQVVSVLIEYYMKLYYSTLYEEKFQIWWRISKYIDFRAKEQTETAHKQLNRNIARSIICFVCFLCRFSWVWWSKETLYWFSNLVNKWAIEMATLSGMLN